MSVTTSQTASFIINGITSTGGTGLNLVASPSLLASNVSWDDYEAEIYAINPLTDYTSISMEEIVTGRVIWVQTDNPINLRLSQVAGLTRAALVLADITYTAKVLGTIGNSITIQYIAGGTAGSETVTVAGTAITVAIANGASTAAQIETALAASAAASSLATIVVTGTPGNAQSTMLTPSPLVGGTSGTVDSNVLVRTFYHANIDFTSIAVANESASTAQFNLVFVGDRIANPGSPGIY
jgi:hypothetical protein